MESSNNSNYYSTSDLKLQAFLRALYPETFCGINKSERKIKFLFKNSKDVTDAVDGYLEGKSFSFPPLSMSHYLDEGKSLIFGDYKS